MSQQLTGHHGRRLAVDVDGTFIDYVLLDEETGEVAIDKEAAYRDEIAKQLFVGLDRVTRERGDITRFIHGSTLAINTVLQEAGASIGLITTRGFRDVLEIGRGNRPKSIYDMSFRPPRALVPRYLRREVSERVDFEGNELEPLAFDEVDSEVDFLVEAGVEAVAICFLHGYANHEHERLAKQRIQERHPSLHVTASYEVATEWREFERTSSTVLNGYVMPIVTRYFAEVEAGLAARKFSGNLAIMQSNGGIMPSRVARNVPLRTLESGPAGGVVGARALAEAMGESNVICADVGGTSFDVALIHDGAVIERFRTDVDGRPVLAPTVDIISVGAGGGSIAWIDDRGSLRVGPESAGSRPGPACFGQGGDRPTVTDCNVVLGRLDPGRFLGSRMKLDVDAARAAIGRVAERLDMSVEDAAAGAIKVAEADMGYALRLMTVERGYDPRHFAMLSYGGGGGLFAAALIRDLEIPRAIVPTAAAVFSAWGLLFADYREDASLTRVLRVRSGDEDAFVATVRQVLDEARSKLADHGIFGEQAICAARADVRFAGQEHTLTAPIVLLDDPVETVQRLREAFAERHRAQYGQADLSRDIEVVTVRATATGRVKHPDIRAGANRQAGEASPGMRQVWFSSVDSFVEAEIWSRTELTTSTVVSGPAVIEEWNTTIPVGPGQQAAIDDFGNLIITNKA